MNVKSAWKDKSGTERQPPYTRAPRTESKNTLIKKNTATDKVNTLQSTTIAQRPTTAGNRQENHYERRPQQARPQAAARAPAPLSVIYGPETIAYRCSV